MSLLYMMKHGWNTSVNFNIHLILKQTTFCCFGSHLLDFCHTNVSAFHSVGEHSLGAIKHVLFLGTELGDRESTSAPKLFSDTICIHGQSTPEMRSLTVLLLMESKFSLLNSLALNQ